jgi:hypothetical protein
MAYVPAPVLFEPRPELPPTYQSLRRRKFFRWTGIIGGICAIILVINQVGFKPDLYAQMPAPVESLKVTSWQTPAMDLPENFKQEVKSLSGKVVLIAQEEGVPPEVPFVLWFKESGGRRVNPSNGEGICGFYDLRVSGTRWFTPGAISEEELLSQLRLCAKEFKKRSGDSVSYETIDLNVLGPIYMRYNGNIDCYGSPFVDYTFHPYVMNGWDDAHMGMIARDGQGGCVPLKIIGAIPAHVRVGMILREK